jgi:hypothetical protein
MRELEDVVVDYGRARPKYSVGMTSDWYLQMQ